MRWRRHLVLRALIAPTIACSIGAAALAQGSLDQRHYVEQVLRAGLEARVAEAEAVLGTAEAVGAGAWSNPILGWQRESAAAGQGTRATQDIFSVTLPLVLSGRLGLEREAALKVGEAAQARRARARAELRYEAVRRFHEAVAASERRAVLADSLAALQRLAEVITRREKAGDASGYDRLRIALEAAGVEDLLRGVAAEERRARGSALALLGPEYESLPALGGAVAEVRPGATLGTLPEHFEGRRADLEALRLEASAAEAARRAAARAWIPEPSLSGGAQVLNLGRAGETTGYVVGVELPLPVFQRRQGEAARAEARRNLAEARRAALAREARTRLGSALANADDRRARLEAHRRQVLGRAEELRTVAATAYRGGAADLLVLVDAERAWREARLGAIQLGLSVIEADNDVALLAGSYDALESRSHGP